ncbi:hypothetical protein M407DRAFT_62335, partial [Tulasnella calospora MUT 4182]
LPTHPNIVTLYRTLQTPSYLLLVLESVPGQDLYYFLEQSRDHAHFVSDDPPLSMCDAVDACHSRGVSHRDIKPENFIVTEGLREGFGAERKVVVKLSDFGLATLQQESADVDCGSAPYMSYECRNNVAPTYATQPADVWSLGIVLINM